MSRLKWDEVGTRAFQTGVDHGALFVQDDSGNYGEGVAWSGLTAVNENPSGGEATKMYADNMKYLNLLSAEEFGCTIEAYDYPEEFAVCDGTAEIAPGVYLGQQSRRGFGFAYRTKVGNDVNQDLGYILHLVYGCKAQPSARNYGTQNESPDAINFSWTVETTKVPVTDDRFKPTSLITIDSTKVAAAKYKNIEDLVYGTSEEKPKLPSPDEIIELLIPSNQSNPVG